MSFFSRYKNFILEIHNPNNFVFSSESLIFPVFNLGEWKLTPSSKQTKLNILSENLLKFNELKLKHTKPMGILVSSTAEVQLAANMADFLYIPGELCRQSDILEACQTTSLPIFIEKGNFLAPSDLMRVAEKLKATDFALIDCGTAFGYSDVVLDPRALYTLKSLSIPFGINLSQLLTPEGTLYQHRPQWLQNPNFLDAFLETGRCFGAQFYVVNNTTHVKYLSKNFNIN